MSINRILPTDTNLGDILSNVLPTTGTGLMMGPNAASVAAILGAVGPVGPIGSKPGDPIMNNGNTSNGNGGPPGLIGGMHSGLGIASHSNGMVDGMGGFLGGMPDFSDVLRNTCRSPPEQQLQQNSLTNNHGGNGSGAPFGTQSFASAVSSYSGVAAANSISDNRSSSNNISTSSNSNNVTGMMNHHHSGKFFDKSPLGPGNGSGTLPGSFDMVGNLMNGPVGSSWKGAGNNGTPLGGNQSLYEHIDNAFSLGFPMEQDRDYSLFPSAGLSTSSYKPLSLLLNLYEVKCSIKISYSFQNNQIKAEMILPALLTKI